MILNNDIFKFHTRIHQLLCPLKLLISEPMYMFYLFIYFHGSLQCPNALTIFSRLVCFPFIPWPQQTSSSVSQHINSAIVSSAELWVEEHRFSVSYMFSSLSLSSPSSGTQHVFVLFALHGGFETHDISNGKLWFYPSLQQCHRDKNSTGTNNTRAQKVLRSTSLQKYARFWILSFVGMYWNCMNEWMCGSHMDF